MFLVCSRENQDVLVFQSLQRHVRPDAGYALAHLVKKPCTERYVSKRYSKISTPIRSRAAISNFELPMLDDLVREANILVLRGQLREKK